MKGKTKAYLSLGTKLGLPAVFLLCLFFFLAGLFGFLLLSQVARFLSMYPSNSSVWTLIFRFWVFNYSIGWQDISSVRPRPRLLESVDDERELEPLPHGMTGDASFTSIPFQVIHFNRYLFLHTFEFFTIILTCSSLIGLICQWFGGIALFNMRYCWLSKQKSGPQQPSQKSLFSFFFSCFFLSFMNLAKKKNSFVRYLIIKWATDTVLGASLLKALQECSN